MKPKIFINLPVRDVAASMAFYESAGFTVNPEFSDQTALCMVYSEEIYVMLLNHDKFNQFINKPIADTQGAIAAIFALEMDSNASVDLTMQKVLAAGGNEPNEARDYGFMYQRTFEDLDGHLWEVFYMDMSAFPVAPSDWVESDNTLKAEVFIHASAARVWECFTSPGHIVKWNHASADWHCPGAVNNLIPQGKFSYTMSSVDGAMSFEFSGTYTKIITHRLIEFALDDNRRVRVQFLPEKEGMRVLEYFEAESMNPKDLQQSGWQSIMNNFKTQAESH